ncbi:cytosolic endo-beta-n-acetylglucosaminidase [Stylonychia lemnae]|uniref:Cytosolic endo-beta-n-acetylglucosaminidase n=1 Tax=Stylonychia lemnae TaxID=5949 RepID=A0A078AEG9_STYLE|nr:cytosolic endo-beta-n-acetylglucosaminidase [Stylonychia lemnae]|eukprot:CDW80610.1 cytosolic endo-beta-n-acetylglucosaminidase [Stylonychia lemnae]
MRIKDRFKQQALHCPNNHRETQSLKIQEDDTGKSTVKQIILKLQILFQKEIRQDRKQRILAIISPDNEVLFELAIFTMNRIVVFRNERHHLKNYLFNGFIKDFQTCVSNQIDAGNQEEEKQQIHTAQNKSESTQNPIIDLHELMKSNDDEFMFIHSLYELAKFDPLKHCYHKSTVMLAPKKQRDRKVLICHDIMDGLLEEKYSQGLLSHHKFNHWQYIDVFVFFGHYTVTIPPPAYTDIAHQHGVKMLGTLIFEWDEGGKEAKLMLDGKISMFYDENEQDMKFRKDAPDGNQFYARKLVEIAKCFGFDGYLMNFECEVKEVETLLTWLEFLTTEIHKEIPGSLIIWYDSVIHSGELKWQKRLNELNYKFFLVTDGFFTDYKWSTDFLKDNVDNFNLYVKSQNPNLNTYDIYVGNDVYGRGTYGGGQHNIHVAIDEIHKHDTSIAIFGQAFWYQRFDGYTNPRIFNLNEDIFWKGRNLVQFADSTGRLFPQGQQISKERMLKEWNMEVGDKAWAVHQNPISLQFSTIASHKPCEKKFNFTISELIDSKIIEDISELNGIVFLSKVTGTKPNTTDPYRYNITLYDKDMNIIQQLASNSTMDEGFTPCKEHALPIQIFEQIFLSKDIKDTLVSIEIVEVGMDAEVWAGHYGAQFSDERLYLDISKANATACNNTSLHDRFQSRGLEFEDICTYFNIGHGNAYFVDGIEVTKGNYSHHCEYDIVLLKSINQNIQSKLGQDILSQITLDGPHFNGGSCLQILGQLADKNDEVYIPLQDICLRHNPLIELYDIKIAFKFDYPKFKTGCIAMVLQYENSEDEEEIEIFNLEIKSAQLIYTQNSWAIYEERMKTFNKTLKSIGIKIAQTNMTQIDFRLGMVAVVPSVLIEPDKIQLSIKEGYPVIHRNLVSVKKNKKYQDIHIGWDISPSNIQVFIKHYRVFRNEKFIGTTKLDVYFDPQVALDKDNQLEYKIQAISKRNEIISEIKIQPDTI